MLKRIVVFGLLIVVAAKSSHLFSQTAICGGTGSGGPALILPSTSNVNLRVIYAYFPSEGFSGTETIPSFANTAGRLL